MSCILQAQPYSHTYLHTASIHTDPLYPSRSDPLQQLQFKHPSIPATQLIHSQPRIHCTRLNWVWIQQSDVAHARLTHSWIAITLPLFHFRYRSSPIQTSAAPFNAHRPQHPRSCLPPADTSGLNTCFTTSCSPLPTLPFLQNSFLHNHHLLFLLSIIYTPAALFQLNNAHYPTLPCQTACLTMPVF